MNRLRQLVVVGRQVQAEYEMTDNAKLLTPRRGLLSIAWSSTDLPHETQQAAIKAAVRVPGVSDFKSNCVDVPENAAELPVVRQLFAAFGLNPSKLLRLFVDDVQPNQMWTPKRAPFAYQAEGALDIVRNRTKLLAYDMGLGKTSLTIQAAETVRRKFAPRPVVIIAPLFVRATWRMELLATGAIESADQLCQLNSRDFNDNSWNPSAPYIFCHYDVVAAWWSRIIMRQPCFVVLDEGHRAKNGRADRSRGSMMVCGTAPYRVIATATPMENRPAELWHLLSMLTSPYAFGSPNEFRIRYAGAEHNGHGYQDMQPTHSEELQKRMEKIYVRKTAEDVGLDLPPMTRQFIEIDPEGALSEHESMTTDQMRRLVQAVKDGHVSEVLPVLTTLRKETSALKLQHTVEYVDNAVACGEKVVVFTWQRVQAQKIAKKLETKHGHKVLCVTGEDNIDVRDGYVAAFQAGEAAVIVATLGALKDGVTLHAARIVVMHDLDWVPAAMRQAERRVLRIGQNRACISAWMMCRKSVDMIFAAMLVKKLGFIEASIAESVDGFEGLNDIVKREDSALMQTQIQDWLTW